MSSFINNFYYGKAGKADFTEDNLPSTRLELFFTTLRLHLSGLVGMNLLYVLFALPLIAWTAINLNLLMFVESEQVLGYMNIYVVALIPCFMILGVGLSGIAYILRNWSRDQHTFTMSDLKDSIKANWKLGLLEGLWTGIMIAVGWFAYVVYGQLAHTSSALFMVPEVLVISLCVLFLMSTMMAYPMLVTYDLKFRHVVRNSLLITMRRLPWSLLIFGLSVLIPFTVLFFFSGSQYVMLALILIYLLFGFSLTEFIYISFANASFDKFLNPLIEGAQLNIGLHQREEEDDDEDEEENQE